MIATIKLKNLFLILLLISSCSFGQGPEFAWGRSMGGSGYERCWAMTTDIEGNVYITGAFNSTVDMDPGPGVSNISTSGGFDVFVQKMDKDGNFLWVKSISSSADVDVNDIATDSQGNVFLAGEFEQTADFDPGPGNYPLTSLGAEDSYILKLSEDGSFLWAHAFGSSSTELEQAYSCTVDVNGNVFVVGRYEGTVDFDPGPTVNNLTPVGDSDGFILKLDVDGNLIWAKTIGGTGPDDFDNVIIDPMGNIILSGSFYGTADLDPGLGVSNLNSSGSYSDSFIIKLDVNGDLVWVEVLTGSGIIWLFDLNTDDLGNILICGIFQNTIDMDPGSGISNATSLGSDDAFIVKLNANGDYHWGNAIGSTDLDRWIGIDADSDGNVIASGFFEGTVDFDPGSGVHNITSDGFDFFLSKFNPDGSFNWVYTFGGSGSEFNTDMCMDNNGAIYTTGRFSSTNLDLDPSSNTEEFSSAGFEDIWVQKLYPCYADSTEDIQNQCGESYTWIDGITYYEDNDSAIFVMTNSLGCDSVITLKLTLELYELTLENDGSSLTSNQAGAQYQWVNCDDNYSNIDGATNQTYLASLSGNYAVLIELNACIDTSECGYINASTPNAFSPNNDGKNDVFELGLDGTSNTVTIYNRWGDVVRTFIDYDDINVVWDGTNKNGELIIGTYYYVVVSDTRSSGWVEVIH